MKKPDNLSLVTREDLVVGSWKAVKEDMFKMKRMLESVFEDVRCVEKDDEEE